MNIGIKNLIEFEVKTEVTAKVVGSGDLEVLATPSMIAFMEKAASELVRPFLEQGNTTVGTLVNISHLKASLVGEIIKVESELVEVDRKRLVFKVTASSDAGVIGEGTHERFIVNSEKFMSKLRDK